MIDRTYARSVQSIRDMVDSKIASAKDPKQASARIRALGGQRKQKNAQLDEETQQLMDSPAMVAVQWVEAIRRSRGRSDEAVISEEGGMPKDSGTTAISQSEAPKDWKTIQAGIFKGESGGDYDALFAYSNREGGRFSDVKLTDMTVDEAIQFSDPKGEYGQWVKEELRRSGQDPRIATPMGAYQIVGKTLRGAKKALGLKGNEKMTPDLQDELGKYILQTQGTGAWEGYKEA